MSLRQFDLYFNEKVQMAYISPLMKIIVVYRVDMCNQCDMGYFSFKNYFLVFFVYIRRMFYPQIHIRVFYLCWIFLIAVQIYLSENIFKHLGLIHYDFIIGADTI